MPKNKKRSCLSATNQEPAEIKGVIAYPNEDRTIRFIDSGYHDLFTLPDGGNIVITTRSGEKMVKPCRYIDDYHTAIGSDVYHICQFAELLEKIGAKCALELSERLEKSEKIQNTSHRGRSDEKYFLSPFKSE